MKSPDGTRNQRKIQADSKQSDPSSRNQNSYPIDTVYDGMGWDTARARDFVDSQNLLRTVLGRKHKASLAKSIPPDPCGAVRPRKISELVNCDFLLVRFCAGDPDGGTPSRRKLLLQPSARMSLTVWIPARASGLTFLRIGHSGNKLKHPDHLFTIRTWN